VKPQIFPAFAGRARNQRGFGTLLVAIVLLGIVSVLTLFSMSASLSERRDATNESRYTMAHEVAQAGLDQGLEYIKARSSSVTTTSGGPAGQDGWLPTSYNKTDGKWQFCSSGLTTSGAWNPCDTIEPGKNPSTVRATYMYYTGGTANTPSALNMQDGSGANIVAPLASDSFASTTQSLTAVPTDITSATPKSGFAVSSEVKALLCLMNSVNVGGVVTNKCQTQSWAASAANWPSVGHAYIDPASGFGPYAVTLVSRAQLTATGAADTENTQAVVKESLATYRIINAPPDVPLVASSSITGLGDAEVVTNPNGGGTGIPISIWAPGTIHVDSASGGGSNASFATCQPDEFFQTGGANTGQCTAPSTGAPCTYQGSTTCGPSGKGCSCSAIAKLVGNNGSPYGLGVLSGHFGTNAVAGPDLLGGAGTGGPLPPVQFFPVSPLNTPPNILDNSLFEYVFQTPVADANSILLDTDGNSVDDATDWEKQNMKVITTAQCGALNDASGQKDSFKYLKKGDSCTLPNAQVGSPLYPVVLVVQGDFKLGNGVFFGIIFVRSPAAIGQSLATTAGYSVQIQGNAQVYGAIIVEDGSGNSMKIAGGPEIIYDANTLRNIINGSGNTKLGVMPGSWSDAGRIDLATGIYSE